MKDLRHHEVLPPPDIMRLKSSSQSDKRSSSASSMIVYLVTVSKAEKFNHLNTLLDTAKRQNMRLLHKIKQPSRSSDEDIAALLEFVSLSPHGGTTIRNAGPQHGPVAETSSFIEDLGRQFTGRGHNQHQRLCANRVGHRVVSSAQVGTGSSQSLRLAHQLGKDGNEEGSGLSGA